MKRGGNDIASAVRESPRRRILVVDDFPIFRDLMQQLLGRQHEVIEACDVEAALERVRQAKPDLILCDVYLKEGDGYELMDALRHMPGMAEVPVIIVSGMGETERERALAAGAADFLEKPFNFPTLLDLIARHLPVLST